MSDRLLFRFDESVAGYAETGRHPPAPRRERGFAETHKQAKRMSIRQYPDLYGLMTDLG